MAGRNTKTKLMYGGQEIEIGKSKTKAAVRYTPEARVAKWTRSSRGVVAPPSMDGFEMVSAKRGIDAKLDKLRALPEVAVGSHVWQMGEADENPLVPSGNLYIEFQPKSDADDRAELLADLGLSTKEELTKLCQEIFKTS